MSRATARLKPLQVNGIAKTIDTTRSPQTSQPSSAVVKVRLTLDQLWAQADQKFYVETRRRLRTSIPGQKKSVLDQWEQTYECDNDEAHRKYNQMVDVLQTVLDGVEVVGAFAAQAASMAFAPAGMCFNAIAFLIDAPRQIKKVYDTLEALFKEVSDFLVKFKVYKRIDDRVGLDEDLILNTNKLLISFVRICGLSINLLEGHKVVVALKAVFLKDDSGVSRELENFRLLSLSQSQLAGAVTLEHVLKSEEDVKQILSTAGETNQLVKSIAAASSDEKTKAVNKERLNTIERKLFAKRDLLTEISSEMSAQVASLPGTLETLEATPEYKDWLNKAGRTALFLFGNHGSGKTQMFEALREKLDSDRQELSRDDPSIYVAYHVFNARRARIANDDRKKESAIPVALKNMALQVARQSTIYAKTLERQLQELKSLSLIEDIEEVWASLKICTFAAPPGSTVYLLFDGMEQEPENKITELLDVLVNAKRRRHDSDSLNVRIILGGSQMLPVRFGALVPKLDISDINKDLLKAFIDKELKRLQLFQDHDKKTVGHRDTVRSSLLPRAAGDFNLARQKLERLLEAVLNDSPASVLTSIIEDDIDVANHEEGQRILDSLQASLSPRYLPQLNQLLMWLFYTRNHCMMQISDLEAALYLEQGSYTLEPLAKKCKERFHQVFEWWNDVLTIKYPVEDALQKSEEILPHASTESANLISMNIIIKNAEESFVRQFVWDLNEQMTSGKFDFSTHMNSTTKQRIYVNRFEGQLAITRLCLKVLNEERQEPTEVFIEYALDFLPRHLTELRKLLTHLSSEDKKMVGQGLVGFLSDPYNIENEKLRLLSAGDDWLKETEHVQSVRFWLEDPETQQQLQPKERRWVKRVLQPENGKFGHMMQVALAMGRMWITRCELDRAFFLWLDNYLDAVSEPTISTDNDENAAAYVPASPTSPLDASAVIVAAETNDIISESTAEQGVAPQTPAKQKTNEAEAIENGLGDEIPHADTEAKVHGDPLPAIIGTELEKSDTVKLTDAERVARAADWVQKHIAQKPSLPFYVNLGYTCYFLEDDATAIQYFEKAMGYSDGNRWRALVALGRAHESLKSTDNAIAFFNEALEALRPLHEANSLREKEQTVFQSVLKELAELYRQSERWEKAIPLREEALRVKPSDGECRFSLLEILCKAGRVQHAIELLEDWAVRAENYGGKRPSDSLHALLEESDGSTYQVVQFVRNIDDEKLRNMLIDALAEAITLAKKESRHAIVVSLLCVQATAIALSSDPNSALTAIELWEEALQVEVPVDGKTWAYRDSIEAASRAISKRKFDSARAKLTSNAEISQQAKEKNWLELKNYIEYVAKAYSDNRYNVGVHSVDRYIASWCFLAKMEQRGREVCSLELKTALEVLSDHDESNDGEGIDLLVNVLCCRGDKVGALTAWSLLDRRSRVKKCSNESTHQIQPVSTRDIWESKPDDCLFVYCKICHELMKSSSTDGIWYCRFCPSTPLCANCILKMQKKELDAARLDLCSTEHEFWHFYHTDYTPEETAPGKVRIDWELQELGDGNFERKDGRIVDLKDWIEQLRVSWELPELDVESHAQK